MRSLAIALAALSFVVPAAASAMPPPLPLEWLADDALKNDTLAWDFTEGVTTEVGPRLAGSEAEARARAFAVAWLKAHGFANVHVEDFSIPGWERGEARAEIVGPFAQLSDALSAATDSEFDIALIDINLGADNSAPIAEILDRRRVPFAFTTGYNDLIFLPPLLREYPHLTKPYNPADVKDLVAKLQHQASERVAIARDESNQVA